MEQFITFGGKHRLILFDSGLVETGRHLHGLRPSGVIHVAGVVVAHFSRFVIVGRLSPLCIVARLVHFQLFG